jgi:ATP-dependent RNA helicase DeaD
MTQAPTFEALRPELAAALAKRGFTAPTAVQAAVLAEDASVTNLRISSQTGSGKTLAIGFALGNAVSRAEEERDEEGPRVLFLAPTRELAVQVAGELSWLYRGLKVKCIAVTGGTDMGRERHALRARPEVLVATPGRLLDHLRQENLSTGAVRHVVLDEADRMLDMGFRDELEAVFALIPAERRNHLISATFPGHVRRFADRFQGAYVHVEGTPLGEAHADIDHVAHLVRPGDRYAALVNTLLMVPGERCLVFVRRRADAADVAEQLAGDGFIAMPLSGDLPQAQRTRTLAAFKSGTIHTLVATDVAARGIDVADIHTVVHYELPTDADTYTHRSGRTGRAGQKGRSVLLAVPQLEERMRHLLRGLGVEARWVPPPDRIAVRQAAMAKGRAALDALFAADREPSAEHREHARELLSRCDPELLVAHLLERSEPELPCAPRDVAVVEPRKRARADRDRKDDRGGRTGRDRAAGRRPAKFTLFYINWGQQKGATPARVLALVCRRGNISSKHVGSVNIDARWTKLEVADEVAGEFAGLVAKPDERDPKIRIRRWEESPKRGGRRQGEVM